MSDPNSVARMLSDLSLKLQKEASDSAKELRESVPPKEKPTDKSVPKENPDEAKLKQSVPKAKPADKSVSKERPDEAKLKQSVPKEKPADKSVSKERPDEAKCNCMDYTIEKLQSMSDENLQLLSKKFNVEKSDKRNTLIVKINQSSCKCTNCKCNVR